MGVCACGLIMVMCVEGKKEKEGTNEKVTRGGDGKEKIGSDIGGLCFVLFLDFGYVWMEWGTALCTDMYHWFSLVYFCLVTNMYINIYVIIIIIKQ